MAAAPPFNVLEGEEGDGGEPERDVAVGELREGDDNEP